ncbi:MAG: DUF1631 family protein [Oleiphilaceae bacterium]|nr:DUF1631 family protein [Oleiphilaceae bacterium]
MSRTPDFATVDAIIQQLRVPEFRYASEDSLSSEARAKVIDKIKCVYLEGEQQALLKTLSAVFPGKALPISLINGAFVADRVFDVWGRKSHLHEELTVHLRALRFVFFLCLTHSELRTFLVDPCRSILDSLGSNAIGWMPHPQRSKAIYLEQISQAAQHMLKACFDGQGHSDVASQWQSFIESQHAKVIKLRTRLAESERNNALARYHRSMAIHYTNQYLSNRLLSNGAAAFIKTDYIELLAAAYKTGDQEQIEHVETLLKMIVAAYGAKGNAAFKLANTLLDDIQAACDQLHVAVAESVWQRLDHDLLQILQKQIVEEQLHQAIESEDPLVAELDQSSSYPRTDQWYINEDGIRLHLSCAIEPARQLLFTNYLGMKIEVETLGQFERHLKEKVIKRLKPEASFTEVFKSTASGLLKVAESQKKTRAAAAEKARQEALRLQQEQQQAEEQAKQRAEEIARRTKEIKLKQEEKKRLEQEQLVRTALAKLQLGAWISRIHPDTQEKERYKLAVKFSAKNKFLFVDKLGIRKLEYNEESFIADVLTNRIEILSEGAEFEDSLERVVSRLRMSK